MSDSDHDAWTLELPDAERLAEILAVPPSLGPRLTDAARRYKKEFLQHSAQRLQMSMDDRIEKLELFFKEIANLTANHKVLADHAVVYPADLGEALSRVDPDWYHNTVDSEVKEIIKAKRLAALAGLAAYDQELALCDSPRKAAHDDLAKSELEAGKYNDTPIPEGKSDL
jgi:hypothetical protein